MSKALANTAEAQNAQGAPAQRRQCGEAPVGVLDPEAWQLLCRGEHQCQRELGHLLGIGALSAGDRGPAKDPFGVKIDARRHQLHPLQPPGPLYRRAVDPLTPHIDRAQDEHVGGHFKAQLTGRNIDDSMTR